ncbi:hypothetical protein N7456_004949 [Penicillium angulare]|uniref:BZIP domain-containing protein n=1 Tax=Penicillium angulare TaxID=116970 RepID=A0A9W9FXL4_9EURO|nr:hypothetical protein N7456_004949 [Penicillium angulare]
MAELSAAEKKRLRDRRAQQNLRDKKLRHQANLEEKVAHCEQYHNENGVQELLQIITDLRKQNDTHVARHESLKHLMTFWDKDTQGAGNSNLWPSPGSIATESTAQTTLERIPILNTSPTAASPTLPTRPRSLASAASGWDKPPLYSDDFSDPKTLYCAWFAYPEQVASCPDNLSPLQILYGDHANMLANMIHLRIERRPVRDPEKLAMGWVMYHFSRWIVAPSPETYEQIPMCFRPTEDQMTTPHPLALSWIPWPKVRLNVIRQWQIYKMDQESLFGLLSCCVKIRWPWGVKILERDSRNELCIKPAFLELFMKEEGWGVTPEFISRFPQLMTGVDVSSIVFTIS